MLHNNGQIAKGRNFNPYSDAEMNHMRLIAKYNRDMGYSRHTGSKTRRVLINAINAVSQTFRNAYKRRLF